MKKNIAWLLLVVSWLLLSTPLTSGGLLTSTGLALNMLLLNLGLGVTAWLLQVLGDKNLLVMKLGTLAFSLILLLTTLGAIFLVAVPFFSRHPITREGIMMGGTDPRVVAPFAWEGAGYTLYLTGLFIALYGFYVITLSWGFLLTNLFWRGKELSKLEKGFHWGTLIASGLTVIPLYVFWGAFTIWLSD